MASDSKICQIYECVANIVQECLPDHKPLENPYDSGENGILMWKKGFGIRVSDMENPETFLSKGCEHCVQYFDVVILHLYTCTTPNFGGRIHQECEMLDAIYDLKKCFRECNELDAKCVSAVNVSSLGIELIDIGQAGNSIQAIEVISRIRTEFSP